VIARIWCGAIPTSKSGEYLELVRTMTLPRYLATHGNRAAWYLYRNEADVTRSLMITLWDDIDTITRLAGADYGSPARDPFSSGGWGETETGIQQYEVYSDNPQSARKPRPSMGLEHPSLVARLWRGVVPTKKAEAYLQYLFGFGFRDYEAYDGYRSVHLLRQTEGMRTHILLLSFWSSRQAIMAYAGSNIDRAHYYAYDLECLVDPSPRVEHYEVLSI
jgi:heme-degrading monooxygenase HmoA